MADEDGEEDYVDDSPVFFADTFIQWHLDDAKHDVCPMCNVGPLEKLKMTVRACTRPGCMTQYRLMIPRESWYKARKIAVGEPFDLADFYAEDQEIIIRKRSK